MPKKTAEPDDFCPAGVTLVAERPPVVDMTIKILTLGDAATGKSSLLQRFTKGPTADLKSITSTMGIDIGTRAVVFDGTKTVSLNCWDTAGQERFRAIAENYYRGCHGILLVYDVTRRGSFESVRDWLSTMAGNSGYADVVLVGNKKDLEGSRVISTAEAENLARYLGIPFFETSALKSQNVNAAFLTLAQAAFRRIEAKKAGGAGGAAAGGAGGKPGKGGKGGKGGAAAGGAGAAAAAAPAGETWKDRILAPEFEWKRALSGALGGGGAAAGRAGKAAAVKCPVTTVTSSSTTASDDDDDDDDGKHHGAAGAGTDKSSSKVVQLGNSSDGHTGSRVPAAAGKQRAGGSAGEEGGGGKCGC